MRSWTKILPFAVVSLLMVMTVSAGCGDNAGTQKAGAEAPSTTNRGPGTMEQKVAPDASGATQEQPAGPTATLTVIEGGERKTREVAYLAPGRKIATIETTKGVVKVELWEAKTPNTVLNFVFLANAGRYDGVDFHRVIDGFMAQTGDVERKGGFGGPGYTIPAEFDASLKHVRGVISMARSTEPDSAGSQFFIMLASTPNLDGQYAAFGQVIQGMDVIDAIKKGDRAKNGTVVDPDKIVKLRVESVPQE